MRVEEGTLTVTSAATVLEATRGRRTTGRLVFESRTARGELRLVRGLVEEPPTTLAESPGDDARPLETFRALREGSYRVEQRLPALPVSRGDADSRHGSLGVHTPSSLAAYCDRIGLTGLLRLVSAGRVAEIGYDRGDIVAIRLDGEDDADLDALFTWTEGTFDVSALLSAPVFDEDAALDGEPTSRFARPPRDETARHFLRIVEVELTRIVRELEKRSAIEGAASAPSTSAASADTEGRPSSTVRVVYVARDDRRDPLPADDSPRAAVRGASAPDAETTPRRLVDGSTHDAPTDEPSRWTAVAVSAAWALFVLFLFTMALATLAALPLAR